MLIHFIREIQIVLSLASSECKYIIFYMLLPLGIAYSPRAILERLPALH